jgi:uncharacterized Tic20 family protein
MTNTASTNPRQPNAGAAPATQAGRQPLAPSELRAGAWSHYGPALSIAVGVVIWPVALLVIGIPLYFRLTAGRRSGYVREQSTAALNFIVTYLVALGIGLAVAVFLGFTALLLLLPAILAFLVLQIVLLIKAGKAAAAGTQYRYPFSLPVLR